MANKHRIAQDRLNTDLLLQVELAQNAIKTLGEHHAKARDNLRDTVKAARKKHTLAEIGQVLGMTRQAVYELLKR